MQRSNAGIWTKYKMIIRLLVGVSACLVIAIFFSFGLDPNQQTSPIPQERCDIIDGVTVVAPPREFPGNPMDHVDQVGAGWISTVPYGMFRIGKTNISFNSGHQWWGEREEGIRTTADLAHSKGIKVMLKPQLWSHTGWIGDQKFESDEEWTEWEKSYTAFISYFAKLAQEDDIEMLCIGTELKSHWKARPQYYIDLIANLRTIYDGELIYSANWDSYNEIAFWDKLDYIGLSAYFPLSEEVTPSVEDLQIKWKPITKQLEKISNNHQKKIVFTEFGYLSVDGAAGKTWLLEKNVKRLAVNEQAQANSYSALFSVFENEAYWGGGFLWKWFPFGQGGEGYNERDYTPQGKKAEQILSNYYQKW